MQDTHRVYVDGSAEIYDSIMCLTSISTNNNKFAVIQVLQRKESTEPDLLFVFTRWGRVGEFGASQTAGPMPLNDAILEFKTFFKSKTGINFENRRSTSPLKEKYMWIDVEY
ncbi:WGR domain-containing protein [Auriculariales sp. MPI-PUGE-AT-0066]|nr:WGR domain-containing protein [Auriculariales sp. MPI-PUGE-AT-0066]